MHVLELGDVVVAVAVAADGADVLGVALGLVGGGHDGLRVAVAGGGNLFGVAVAALTGEGLQTGCGAGRVLGDLLGVAVHVLELGDVVVPVAGAAVDAGVLGVALGLIGGRHHGVVVAVAGGGDDLAHGLVALGAGQVAHTVALTGGGGHGALVPAVLVDGRLNGDEGVVRDGLDGDLLVFPLGDQRAVGIGLDLGAGAHVHHGAAAVGQLPAGEALARHALEHGLHREARAEAAALGGGNVGIGLAAAVGDGDVADLLEKLQTDQQRVAAADIGEAGAVKGPGIVLIGEFRAFERHPGAGRAGIVGRALQRGGGLPGRQLAGVDVRLSDIVALGRGDGQIAVHQVGQADRGPVAQLAAAEVHAQVFPLGQVDRLAVHPRGDFISVRVDRGDVHRDRQRLISGHRGIGLGARGHACDLEHEYQNEQEAQGAFPILLHFHSPHKLFALSGPRGPELLQYHYRCAFFGKQHKNS